MGFIFFLNFHHQANLQSSLDSAVYGDLLKSMDNWIIGNLHEFPKTATQHR